MVEVCAYWFDFATDRRGGVMERLRARSAECVRSTSGYEDHERRRRADDASERAWREGKILIVRLDHPALDFADREMVKLLAKRIGVQK